jgi:rare lipoprotein A
VRWALVACALALACAHPRTAGVESRPPEEPSRPAPRREVGIASYYARSLEGRRTASGVPYDGRAMTCAHPTLPFGTLLRVTDVESGKSVVVKVIDRGPFAPGRIVDLSWAAARELGMLTRGLARVAIELAGGR